MQGRFQGSSASAPFRAVVIGALAALALAIPATASATSTSAASGLRVAEGTYADFSNLSLTAQRNHVVILQPWQTDQLHQIKAANPDTIVLCHKNFGGATNSVNGPTGLYSSGVSYQEAASQHPEWFLKDSSGNRITFYGYSGLYAMDAGSASYQQAWADNVIHELQQTGFDGVLMDNVDATLQYDFSGSVKYPNDVEWRTAMGSALSYVGPRLQSAGLVAIANIGGWGGNPTTGRSWLQYLSGGMDEMFAKWGNTPGSGYADPGRWQTALDSLKYAQQHGKEFLAVTHSAKGDEQAAVYGWASVLLAGDGQADYTMAPDYESENWFPEYGYDIGHPTGFESTDPNGVHRRLFSNGIVLVNPTTSPKTVSFGGSYTGSGLNGQTGATMPGQTGLVLVSDAPPPPPPPPTQYTLSVSTGGSGAGAVSGPGISCPGDCTQSYDDGTQVTLAGTGATGSSFTGWGGDCSGSGSCTLTMSADRSATAGFDQDPPPPPPPPTQDTLTVDTGGSGTGTVTGPGIACPGDCTESYDDGTQVTLQSTGDAGSSFKGWEQDCSGAKDSCTLTMSTDHAAAAKFDVDPPPPPPPNQPPTVAVTSPTNGDSVGRWLHLSAEASDDIGVTRVRFSIDGEPVGGDSAAPYSMTWRPSLRRVSVGTHTVTAEAFDTDGASTTSAPVSFTRVHAKSLRASISAKTSRRKIRSYAPRSR